MSIVQWLILIVVIAVVAGIYWYVRGQTGNDPWRGMEQSDKATDEEANEHSSVEADSYIVGVRTLSSDESSTFARTAQRQGDAQSARTSEDISADEAHAAWQAYKQPEAGAPAPSANGTSDQASSAEPPGAPQPSPTERVEMREPPAPTADQQIFILHVASPDGRFFDGPTVHAALRQQNLKFGLKDLYHRITEVHGVTDSVYAVANMLKPGTLDPDNEDHLSTPGLTFFLIAPGPIESIKAMQDMMETANAVAQAVGGEVLDDQRAVLKAQTAQYMLDQLAELDRKARLTRRRG